ncbi:P-loop containing nucleoside triphosphate hydrolase protein [Hortaea werneckii]|nr:P-loop containing nucleoside triphosphate hydrolase protein [Hortaea werneckii]KAI6889370.1 P-loop containing nucleoside triphosphate hydrolase protein [Hortaea werneckii]KAI7001162.1 P-loop containing nucleoside triphosphate hydrolase protein [Hortaea werneckii]KAI7145490.1 P-loop containing nucleoside triphosphate hydrolase protein [Hortaea werneckii]KAI7174242.1 P-loop containing nucleoside triphosphate hydrolase protein [Hortaea werneckii]
MPKFVPRDRKQRRLPKQEQNGTDTNSEELVAETKSERDARRAKLAADLRDQQPQSKISSKKRKRLDKYVDSKLKKEENLELLKKLAAHKVDTSLLQSSKKLGRAGETKRERFSRALQEQAAGIGDHDDVLLEQRPEALQDASSDEDEDNAAEEATEAAPIAPAPEKPALGFGGGLKRPLDVGEDGRPVIKKRKRRKKERPSFPQPDYDDQASSDDGVGEEDDRAAAGDRSEDEWGGFSDSGEAQEDVASNESGSEISDDGEELSDEESDDDSEGDDQEEEDDDDDDSESLPSVASDRKERVSAFKQWADSQRNTALDFTPSAPLATSAQIDEKVKANFRPREPSPDPMLVASTTQANGERTSRPAAAITIPRDEDIQEARMQLPVVQEEQKIMEAVHSNPIIIVCGATGSGKTTQVPQMMFESGYGSHVGEQTTNEAAGMQSKGMIGVTQPRRVAAVSVAERVATELGGSYKGRVAHQVRYDTNVNRDTAIKFMTDGILLREISQDFILSKYSSIVLDEAHERSVNTDILIGMLSRIVRLRSELAREQPEKYYPLKLVIMSATLRVSDFAENPRLFRDGAPPIVQAEGRQFPVEVHWSRKTQRDFVSEAVSKVARGHRKLPPGSMLVFLTSQNEIQVTAKRLKEKLGGANNATYGFGKAKEEAKHRPLEADDFDDDDGRRNNDYLEGEEDADSDSEPEITGLDSEADDAEFNIAEEESHFGPRDRGVLKPHILPLYAALPSAQQLKVFQPPPPGHRLIVLATNVAETSLTIPGVRYVFDSGRAKEKRYDLSTGVQTFEIDWISKASASQRAGRAGRTGPGHVYRLYSSAVYEQFFAEHTVPEILRTPLESTVLQLKAMDIDNVVNFPFPTSPDTNQLAQAERLLKNLGAISERDGTITERGIEMMGYPVSPRFAKMLILAKMNGILDLAVAVVAGLAVGDLFIQEAQAANEDAIGDDDDSTDDDDSDAETRREKRQMQTAAQTAARKRHQAFTSAQAKLARRDDKSDVAKLLTAIAVHAEKSGKDQPMSAASTFCEEFFLREKGMSEVQQLRRQLQNIVSARQAPAAAPGASNFQDVLPKPTDKDLARLNQIVAAGFLDQIAIRSDLLPSASETVSAFGRKPRRAVEVPYQTLLPSAEVDKSLAPHEQELQRSVFIHPSSVLAKLTVSEMPRYIVYSHLSRAAPSATIAASKVPRTRMHPLTAIEEGKVLANLAEGTPLLEFGKPLGRIEELGGSTRRQCLVSVALKAPTGIASWPLTAWKVVQRRGRRDWEVEKIVAR